MPIKILDVGQCGFDGPRMASLWEDELGAAVDQADSGEDAVQQAKGGKYDLILVNRVLADDGSSGLDVIKDLIDSGTNTPVMLVSDRDDAQEKAVKLGAMRGFGKAELDSPTTLKLVADTAKKHHKKA